MAVNVEKLSDVGDVTCWLLSVLPKDDIQRRCCKTLLDTYALHTTRKILNKQRNWIYLNGKEECLEDTEDILNEFFNLCYEILDEGKIFKDWLTMIKDLEPSPTALDILELIGEDARYGSLWRLAVRQLVKEILDYFASDD